MRRTAGVNRAALTAQRGFTLLETMLALILGALVILASMSLFRVLDRSQERQQKRMEENLMFARAHNVVGRVLQSLLMSSEALTEQEIEDRLKEDDVRNAEDLSGLRDADAETARLALQPDPAGFVMMVSTDRGERRALSQTFRVTLRTSPITVGDDKPEDELALDEVKRAVVLQRAMARIGQRADPEIEAMAASAGQLLPVEQTGRNSRDRRSESSVGMDSGRTDESRVGMRARARGSGGSGGRDAAEADSLIADALSGANSAESTSELSASERLTQNTLDQPRAPGVRGVFEVLPDGESPGGLGGESLLGLDSGRVGGGSNDSDGPTYSLWWRELPRLAGDDEDDLLGDETEDQPKSASERLEDRERETTGRTSTKNSRSDRAAELNALADASDTSGKRELLLSGLKTIHWTAVRGKKPRDKITATYDKELPAYVELEIETVNGRNEKWMFEVAWVKGPEPGSIVQQAADPLDALAAGGIGGPGNPDGTAGDPSTPGDGQGGTVSDAPKPNDGGVSYDPRTGRPSTPTSNPGTGYQNKPGDLPTTKPGSNPTIKPVPGDRRFDSKPR